MDKSSDVSTVDLFVWSDEILLLVQLEINIKNNCKSQVYYMSTKTKFNVIYWNHVFHSHSILNPPFPTLSTFPSYPTELYNPKSKVIFVCLINDYSLITDLHILYMYVYARAECESISLRCTTVKLYEINHPIINWIEFLQNRTGSWGSPLLYITLPLFFSHSNI